MSSRTRIDEAIIVLAALGMPRAQQNDRSALCLLALLDLTPDRSWAEARDPLVGITPMMEFSRKYYGTRYAPNTRETFRRQTIHQFMDAGIALYNPDDPARAVNSPKAVYQIEPDALDLLRTFGGRHWKRSLRIYLSRRESLSVRYARERKRRQIPVVIAPGEEIHLTPGDHSELVKAIVEDFAPRFVPGAVLIYAGDTGDKWAYFDESSLNALDVIVDVHGKMPDVVIHDLERGWLLLVECVTSHGPVDSKRHNELARLFSRSSSGLVFVTAFPNRSIMARYLAEIAWETEVWCADSPSHLIHFNGERFLGPHCDS